ncbi:MAG: hypothetical protein ABL949_16770, partial [Fimbriimonadaceae bacterium]
MHYVYINNTGFYVRSLARTSVKEHLGVYRENSLLDVSEGLLSRGVNLNMSFKEAKIIAPDATWVKW